MWQSLIAFIQNPAQIKCQDNGSFSNFEPHKKHTGKQTVIDTNKSKSELNEKLLQKESAPFPQKQHNDKLEENYHSPKSILYLAHERATQFSFSDCGRSWGHEDWGFDRQGGFLRNS